MKATLEFSLPEEENEFEWAMKGPEYLVALQAVAQAFRDRAGSEESPVWSLAQELFWDAVRETGVEVYT